MTSVNLKPTLARLRLTEQNIYGTK